MSFVRKKISIIGAGHTGSTLALQLMYQQAGDIVLIDTPEKEDVTRGKALDLLQASQVIGSNLDIVGSSSFEDIANSDIVVITAGIARKPGMSRDDLTEFNKSVVEDISRNVKHYAPNSIVIVLTNPVDVMTYVSLKETNFPRNRVIGQSGILDTARFNTFIARELNVSIEDVQGMVLGGHGDEMVPLIRYSNVGGIPIDNLISPERLDEIIDRTKRGGAEIVSLLGEGSAYFAPSASIVQMIEAIFHDKKKLIPTVTYLDGEYGLFDICMGVPTIIGGKGVESIVELKLNLKEKGMLDDSAMLIKNNL